MCMEPASVNGSGVWRGLGRAASAPGEELGDDRFVLQWVERACRVGEQSAHLWRTDRRMGHGAWGMGHGAWGMRHGAWVMGHA